MELKKEIESIEKPSFRNRNWYYYEITTSENFSEMLEDGIKCQVLSKSQNVYDYKFYIPLYKDRMTGNVADWYNLLERSTPMFVIDSKTPTIKCSDNSRLEMFQNTILPLRYSCSCDEYNAFWRIKPNNIIGIQCALYKWSDGKSEIFQSRLEMLKEFLVSMKELEIDIPIYDNSRAKKYETHEIDKDGIMYLSKKMK